MKNRSRFEEGAWAKPYVRDLERHNLEFYWFDGDMIYLPSSLRRAFLQLAPIFDRHKHYVALTFPTVFKMFERLGMAPFSDTPGIAINKLLLEKRLKDGENSAWQGRKTEWWNNFAVFDASNVTFWNPTKFSILFKNATVRAAFCNSVLRYAVSNRTLARSQETS